MADNKSPEKKKVEPGGMGVGIVLNAAFDAALKEMAAGIALGMRTGAALGTGWRQTHQRK